MSVCRRYDIAQLFSHRFCVVAEVNNAGSGHDDLVRLELRGWSAKSCSRVVMAFVLSSLRHCWASGCRLF